MLIFNNWIQISVPIEFWFLNKKHVKISSFHSDSLFWCKYIERQLNSAFFLVSSFNQRNKYLCNFTPQHYLPQSKNDKFHFKNFHLLPLLWSYRIKLASYLLKISRKYKLLRYHWMPIINSLNKQSCWIFVVKQQFHSPLSLLKSEKQKESFSTFVAWLINFRKSF